MSRKPPPKKTITITKHKDKRANIPTEELRAPSLDPQLV